ncbi:MAG: OmpA family protein, partial [Saprospiraceae bacterium]|nr:OmpA family protein [Saprospiraceae bacterium]
FFGLNSAYKGQKGSDLYEKMSNRFKEIGEIPNAAPAWRSVIYTGAIQGANLNGPSYAAEKSKVFAPTTNQEKVSEAFASKPVSITFATGQFKLDENAKTIIDLQFRDIAKSFANTKVRIEGNTDNVGSAATNKALSEKRARSVAEYLKSEYNIDSNRFVIVGNGPSKPVKGCESNATEECRGKNRRTDFQLIN